MQVAGKQSQHVEAMQLSPDQFLQLERIKMQRDVCGHQGSTCTFFIGGNVTPVMDAGRR
jgi:hypothetical protein